MKALTIRQPWASLTLMLDPVGVAFKRVETRGRRTNYRGRIAIHAGLVDEIFFSRCFARKERPHLVVAGLKSDMDIRKLPHGAVIGEVTIADCVPIEELWGTPYCTERDPALPNCNNGYNCNHPDQEEGVEVSDRFIGSCYGWSCPLGYPPDRHDLKKYGVEDYDGEPDSKDEEADFDYIIVTDPEAVRSLRSMGIDGLATRTMEEAEAWEEEHG